MTRSALLICLLLVSGNTIACFVTPEEQTVSVDELIARTATIVLAKVVRAEAMETGEVTYEFIPVRHLRGTSPDSFKLDGYPAIWEGDQETFNHHRDPRFWDRKFGRTPNDTDCQIHPAFAVGGNYLIFMGEPRHSKGFELIIRTHGDTDVKDKWLQYVEDKVGPNNSIKPNLLRKSAYLGR